eukprot:12352808-Alexandrium_andersonii.AAC.1
MRSVFLCVNRMRAEVGVSEVQCETAYRVSYVDVGAYASYEHGWIGRAYQAGVFHLDTEGFGE